MSDLTHLTISAARAKLLAKEITATEITEAYLGAIERANPHAAAVRERFFALADEVRGALDEQAELAPPLAAAAY